MKHTFFWQHTGALPENIDQSQIGQEIAWLFFKHPDLSPKVLISYDRFSLFFRSRRGFPGNFRPKHSLSG